MKAKFNVCIRHPSKWLAASNMPLKAGKKLHNEGYTESCFQETPAIPTYVFTIALMENYTVIDQKNPDGPLIELYAPTKNLEQHQWILDHAQKALDLMRLLTNISYQLPKISLYVVYPSPFWGVENFGLITLEGAFMEMGSKTPRATAILNHEMVHQWIGNVATISEWREICVQEGLTAFLEWKLSQDLQNVSMESQAKEAAGLRRDYASYLIRYNKTQDIADRCFGIPPLFFKRIFDVYGLEVYQKFLNLLLTRKQFENANITFLDKLLVEATGNQKLAGYLESWFGQPGFPYLFISRVNEREIQIMQGQVVDYERVVVSKDTVRPIPLDILMPHGQIKKATLPKAQNFSLSIEGNDGTKDPVVLVDPKGEVVARKIYELSVYEKLSTDQKIVTKDQKSVWGDFCQAIQIDALPWGRDAQAFDKARWAALLKSLLDKDLVDSGCKCCIRSEEENKKKESCYWRWNQDCKQLKINQMLGRNYTLPHGSPFLRPGQDDE